MKNAAFSEIINGEGVGEVGEQRERERDRRKTEQREEEKEKNTTNEPAFFRLCFLVRATWKGES